MADLHSDQRMSSELALSTSTSNYSSTTNSSSIQTSPDGNPTAAPSPQHIIIIPPATCSSASSQVQLLSYRSRKEVWKSLRESTAHAMTLNQLQRSEKEHQKDASTHKKAMRRLSKDLYMILSLYALMEGCVFTAVAQSSIFTCEDLWGPVGFAVAVMMGTISCVLDKLRRMESEKKQVRQFVRRASAVYDKIDQLYWKGAACNIDELEPERGADEDAAGGGHCIFSGHGVLVLGFLVILSLLISVSCVHMLCRQPCHCNALSS